MSRRLSLHILLPIEGYEEDKIYKSEDISLRMADLRHEPGVIIFCIAMEVMEYEQIFRKRLETISQ